MQISSFYFKDESHWAFFWSLEAREIKSLSPLLR